MLKILFSPSEAKRAGGVNSCKKMQHSLLFGFSEKKPLADAYDAIISSENLEKKSKLTGLRKESDLLDYTILSEQHCLKALERYSGVAYDALDYSSLDTASKRYLDEHLLIFSNLFGPIRGDDMIPNYKVKQGENVGDYVPDRYYRQCYQERLHEYLIGYDILDLRAGYYNKFYKVTHPATTLKFLKNGKVLSHYAKRYRGLVLRAVAKANIESFDAFDALNMPTLSLVDIKIKENHREITYAIKE